MSASIAGKTLAAPESLHDDLLEDHVADEISRVGEAIAPKTTSTPSSASSETTSPAAAPPTEVDAGHDRASPTISRTRSRQPSSSVATTSPMPCSPSSATPSARRTSPRTWTPRDAASWPYESADRHRWRRSGRSQSPSETSRKSISAIALNGIENEPRRCLVGDRVGYRDQAGGGGHDAAPPMPNEPPLATRWPIRRCSTPSPRASMTPTASAPAPAGIGPEAVAAAHGPEVMVVDRREQDPHQHLAGRPGWGSGSPRRRGPRRGRRNGAGGAREMPPVSQVPAHWGTCRRSRRPASPAGAPSSGARSGSALGPGALLLDRVPQARRHPDVDRRQTTILDLLAQRARTSERSAVRRRPGRRRRRRGDLRGPGWSRARRAVGGWSTGGGRHHAGRQAGSRPSTAKGAIRIRKV